MENQNKGLKNLVIVLSVLVLGLGGFIIYDKVLSNNDTNMDSEKVESSSTNKLETQGQNKNLMDNAAALNVVENVYNKAMEFYTFDAIDSCKWKTDNNKCIILNDYWKNNPNGGFIKITNYHTAMNEIFTNNGITQFEKFMKEELSTEPFIKDEKGNTYVLAPTSGFYTGYSTRNLQVTNITSDTIKATIDVVDTVAESDNKANAVITKKITIKKENNKWLMEEFAIPMHY